MDNYIFIYTCENGFEGEVIVPAVNRFMAYDTFTEIIKDFESPVNFVYCAKENM